MATGSTWFQACAEQKATPLAKLTRHTGMSQARLLAIDHGDRVSRAELDALSIARSVSAADLVASLPDPALVAE